MSVKGRTTPSIPPLLKNAASAPFVYFDAVPVFGTSLGNIEVEIAARLLMPRADQTIGADMASVAHLRCSPQAALALADALTKAVEMLKQQQASQGEMLKN
jgi:hypothetical protein